MTPDAWFTLGLLSFSFVASNVFWARHCLELTNRIMSRNYFDVATAERIKRKAPAISDEPEFIFDPDDERQAVELNNLMGMAR